MAWRVAPFHLSAQRHLGGHVWAVRRAKGRWDAQSRIRAVAGVTGLKCFQESPPWAGRHMMVWTLPRDATHSRDSRARAPPTCAGRSSAQHAPTRPRPAGRLARCTSPGRRACRPACTPIRAACSRRARPHAHPIWTPGSSHTEGAEPNFRKGGHTWCPYRRHAQPACPRQPWPPC